MLQELPFVSLCEQYQRNQLNQTIHLFKLVFSIQSLIKMTLFLFAFVFFYLCLSLLVFLFLFILLFILISFSIFSKLFRLAILLIFFLFLLIFIKSFSIISIIISFLRLFWAFLHEQSHQALLQFQIPKVYHLNSVKYIQILHSYLDLNLNLLNYIPQLQSLSIIPQQSLPQRLDLSKTVPILTDL